MTKRIVSKKVSKSKSSTKKSIRVVTGEMCFWVNNGPILSSLKDLHVALMRMNDDQFRHHVNKQKNDFALWVKKVLQDDDAAKKLSSSKDKKAAIKAAGLALKSYK